MPFSKSIPNDAGETGIATGGMSGGTRQSFFEAQFAFASVTGGPQSGLRITVSPDRGDGARMGFVAIRDSGTGLAVDLQAYDPTAGGDACNRFQSAVEIVGGLSYAVPHTLKFTIKFVDGVRNDLVQIFVDDVLRATTPTWEDYYRECASQISNNGGVATTRTVDSLLIRVSGTAVPGTAGNGFYIDAMSLNSSAAPAAASVFVRTDGSDIACDGTTNASLADAPAGKCAFETIARGVTGVDNGGTVNVAAGTYDDGATVEITKPVTILGAGMASTILDGLGTVDYGIFAHAGASNLTVKNLKLTNFELDGVFMDGASAVTISNVLFEDVESSGNGRHGFYITPPPASTISNFTLRRVTASGNNPGPAASLSGRGIWMVNGAKSNVTIEDSIFNSNRLVGLDLSLGTVANAIIMGNTVVGNGDSGIAVLGPVTAMTVANNTVTNNGRFGIEIKNPDGPISGVPNFVVNGNTVSRTVDATDARDHAGILVMRRDPVAAGTVDQPSGVLIQNNVVSGYRRKPSGSTGDGFGIVVAGTNVQVRNNIVGDNDVGIQVQAANPDTSANPATQNTDWFDRDNAASFSGIVELNDIKKTNTIGLRGVGAPVSNADVTRNWWGASSGPVNAGNPGATGASAVVTNAATIDFTPFLGHGTDTSASIGFQPDLTPLTTANVLSTGSDTECDGSQNVAFNASLLGACAVATVQRGVNNVQTPGTANTGIVSIGPGTYSETAITLPNKNDLTIKGAQAANRPLISNGLILGTHTNLTLENLMIEGADDSGTAQTFVVRGQGAVTNFTVTNVKIDGENVAQRHGMTSGTFGGNISITNCQFEDIIFRSAFDTASGGGGGNIVNGVFSNNTLTNVKGHVNFRSVASATPAAVIQVTNNTWSLTGNFNNGATANLKVFYAASATITGNTFKDVGTDSAAPASFHAELTTYGTAVMPRNVTNLVVQNNLFQDNNQAIAYEPINDAPGGIPRTLLSGGTIANNTFLNNKFGIYIPAAVHPSGTLTGLTVSENSFVSNVAGAEAIHNGSTLAGNLPAIKNWWGNTSGPTHATNATGTGGVVTNKVTFSPWLADGTDTLAAIGFQPNATPLGFLNTQGINVAPTSGLVTTEHGGTASFAVVLASAPTANVQIGLSSSNTNEGTVSPSSLTFTAANWNVPQTVTATGVAVGAANGNVAYSIVTAAATSTDLSFNGLNPADVSVTNNAAVIPSITIADTSVFEGNGGNTPMPFNVTLSSAPARAVTVEFASQNGTATSSFDYLPASGTLTFAPGETSKPITVQISGDTSFEPNETFLVTLSNPSGATVADSQAIGTIQGDDLDTSAACSPRPNISLQTQAVGGRQQQVTVKADTNAPNQTNVLTQIKFGTPTNSTIQMLGQPSVGTSPITLPAGTRQVVFLVSQTNANSAFHVPFTVNDGCGAVEKFVGGGKDAVAN